MMKIEVDAECGSDYIFGKPAIIMIE